MKQNEIWMPIAGEDRYEASNMGVIRRIESIVDNGTRSPMRLTSRINKGNLQRNGFLSTSMRGRYVYIHRIIAETFITDSPFYGLSIRHKNGIKTDNRVDNLEWCKRQPRKTHQLTTHPLYKVWLNMKSRCNLPTNTAYRHYGGRGIKVCDRWNDSFENFYNDLIDGYRSDLKIERVDNNGNYEPDNCKWATTKEQLMNRRNTIFIEVNGVVKTLNEWSDISKIPKQNIYMRLFAYGWDKYDAVFKPLKNRPNPPLPTITSKNLIRWK